MARTIRHILIAGGSGQVGSELRRLKWLDGIRLHAPASAELDISDPASVADAFARTPFSAVINAAAYTAVDDAEDHAADAYRVNALGPAVLADACRTHAIPLVHVSTDYVFGGVATQAWQETDRPDPRNVYGASKLAGEFAAALANPRSVVVRTAWVFSAHGRNFVKTILRLGAAQTSIRIVADQRGNPTAAADLAAALATITLRLMNDPGAPVGLYHFAGEGDTNWADFARAIINNAKLAAPPEVVEISTADYPTKAKRPADSRLASSKIAADFGIRPRPWADGLRDVVAELNEGGTT